MRNLSPVTNMLSRGEVTASDAAPKMQTIQAAMLADENKTGVEHFEPYGFTSHPLPGAETLAAFLDGDRSHGIAVIVADRRYRIRALEPGEVAIHDDQGASITLKRGGIAIDGGGNAITITNAPALEIDGGDLIASGISFLGHTHGGVQTGSGTSGIPTGSPGGGSGGSSGFSDGDGAALVSYWGTI